MNVKLHETIPHFERLFRCFRWMPMSMPGTRSCPKLRVSPRWASHGVESERNMCGKAKPLSFGVQIFMKSTFSTKDSTRTLETNLLDMIRDVSLPFCPAKPPKVDHAALVASSCCCVPSSGLGKSRHFRHFLQSRLERCRTSLEHRFKKPDIAVWTHT